LSFKEIFQTPFLRRFKKSNKKLSAFDEIVKAHEKSLWGGIVPFF
jgi:hypothetical protein